jgi:hypothetical protein
MVAPSQATRTCAAAEHRLDGDTVPDVDPPSPGGALSDLLDHPERLVSGNHRERHPKRPLELLVIAAADSARLHPHQRVIRSDFGERKIARLELARVRLDHGQGSFRGHRTASR